MSGLAAQAAAQNGLENALSLNVIQLAACLAHAAGF
jgi:hypothetical protein